MKRLLLLPLLLLSICSYSTKYALVIGIGEYPENSGWHRINGDKDVPVVRKMLLENNFTRDDIIELVNAKATFARIKSAFVSLTSKAKSGDIVYIHFSGHGQQVTDIDGDEKDGLDEAWVPYDAQLKYEKNTYEGQYHIIDDMLNVWLTDLREKVGENGKITVVSDACHSGDGSRGDVNDEEEPEYVARGTSDTFDIPSVNVKYNADREKTTDWIYISACKSNQTNYEYRGAGFLTYILSLYTSNIKLLSAQDLMSKIKFEMQKRQLFTQTPTIDASENRLSQTIF